MGFGLFSPPDWALIFSGKWAFPLGLMSGDITPCFLHTFDVFLVLSRHVLLQLTNHQNSWNFVSYEPYF
jgi:hypothetical protein